MKKTSFILVVIVLMACGLITQDPIRPTLVNSTSAPSMKENTLHTLPSDVTRTPHIASSETVQIKTTITSQIPTMTFSPTPAINAPTPSKTPIPSPAISSTPSLDLSNPESIVYWLAYDLANGTSDSFHRVITKDTLLYGTGFAGGRDAISKQKFLGDLEQRIISQPLCVGYTVSDVSLKIWSKNWQPEWSFRGEQISNELVFTFFLYDGDVDTWAYFTPSSDILEIVDHQPCPYFDDTTSSGTPDQDDSKQYGRISNQVLEVNLRRTPGYLGKNDNTDVLVKIPSGEMIEIISGPEEKDSLNWWKITWNGYGGWIADHTASGREIIDFDQ